MQANTRIDADNYKKGRIEKKNEATRVTRMDIKISWKSESDMCVGI